MRRLGLRSVALGYLAVVLLGPVSMVFWKTFERGFGPFFSALTASETTAAFKNTLIILTTNVGTDLIVQATEGGEKRLDPEELSVALKPHLFVLFAVGLLARKRLAHRHVDDWF